MKTSQAGLDFSELKTVLSEQRPVRKEELKQFYLDRDPNMSEQAFRRILYSLEKQGLILSIGAGLFVLLDPTQSPGKNKFIPNLSQEVQRLNSVICEAFPYIHYLTWETKTLHEFMTHQPGQNQIILETEKDVAESVFYRLKEQYSGTVFLNPDRLSIERYVINNRESIIITRLISQSPKMTVNGIPAARLEKILVDIFADENRFFAFQGQEMVSVFENAFSAYWINEKTLFRYASRRRAAEELRAFIATQTQIELSQ